MTKTYEREMQDFAKYKENNHLNFSEEASVWTPDLPSVLVGVIMGGILGVLGLKLAQFQEGRVIEDVPPKTSEVEAGLTFDFYEELKREDLHPPYLAKQLE